MSITEQDKRFAEHLYRERDVVAQLLCGGRGVPVFAEP